MSSLEEEIKYLDQIASKVSQDKTPVESSGFKQIEFLSERPDAEQMLPLIFEFAESDMMLFAGARILEKIINEKWNSLTEHERNGWRDFVIHLLETLPSKLNVSNHLRKNLGEIALKDYPHSWPGFIDFIFESNPPHFLILADFMNMIKGSNLPSERFEEIISSISNSMHSILVSIREHIPNEDSCSLLAELIPYINWNLLLDAGFESFFNDFDVSILPAIVDVLLIPGLSPPLFRQVFITIVEQSSNYIDLIPILQQNLEVLEDVETEEALNTVHMGLISEDYSLTSEYWEFFVVSVCDQYCLGNYDKFCFHQATFESLIENVFYIIPNTYDYILSGSLKRPSDQSNALILDQTTVILHCLILMCPNEFHGYLICGFQRQIEELDDKLFSALVWSISCVLSHPSFNNSMISDVFQLSITLIENNESQERLYAYLLYLGMNCLKNTQLDEEIVKYVLQIAIESLQQESLQRLAIDCLLSCSLSNPNLYSSMIDSSFYLNLSETEFPPEVFCIFAESMFRSLLHKGSFLSGIEILVKRWAMVESIGISFETVHEIRFILSAVIGASKVQPSTVKSQVSSIISSFASLNQQFINTMIEVYYQVGDPMIGRDDIRLMLGVFKNELQLLREINSPEFDSILFLYPELPCVIRPLECLVFSEHLLLNSPSPELISQIREMIIVPSYQMLYEKSEHNDLIVFLPRLIYAQIKSSLSSISIDDIEALLHLLSNGCPDSIKYSMLSIGFLIDNWNNHPNRIEMTKSIFIRMLSSLIISTCELQFRFCFHQLIQLALKLIDVVLQQNDLHILFQDNNYVQILSNSLSQSLQSHFKVIPNNEIEFVSQIIFSKISKEEFERLIVQIDSKSRMINENETMWHIKVMQMKERIGLLQIDK